MTIDPIADLLTRIRNAMNARKDVVVIPSSNMKKAILEVMKNRKFINDYEVIKEKSFEEIEITVNQDKKSLTLKRVSKPGQRIYVKNSQIKKVNGGLGVAIFSTPKGVMSGEEAQKLKLGGEFLCEIC